MAKAEHTNPDPVPEVGAGVSSRQRGPVEEVIARRMKQLGKKLQRYRTYAQADPSTLNADQSAALVALPALEGAYKELEDLTREKGPVDEQELIQAAKLREATEAAKAAAIAESSQSLEAFKSSLVSPLGYFLRLHALLHPVRPTDHQNLTFGHLDLPTHLQDEVQATDVLRVARLMEDLTIGGEGAIAVLDILVSGPDGTDEENDRVHHLIALLAKPEPEVESAAYTPAEGQLETYTEAALAESVQAAVDASPENAVVPEEEEKADELAQPEEEPETSSFGAAIVQEQVVGQIVEEALGSNSVEIPSAEASSSPAPETSNWADLDEEEVVAATPNATGVDTLLETTEPVDSAQDTPGTSRPQSKAGSRGKGPRRPRKPRQPKEGEAATATTPKPSGGNGNEATNGGGRDSKDRKPRERKEKKERKAGPQEQLGAKVVDKDGFEVKVRKTSQAVRGGANGASRGRGGRGRGGANGANGGNGRPAEGNAAPKPKPSILKAVQPTGPKSAPIL